MFSEKQEKFLRGKLKRINLLYGSVRSGKTWISLLKWSIWVGKKPKEHEYLMVGKTLTSLKRNCLVPLEKLIGTKNISYSISQKKAVIFGRTVWLEGANDERSEGKIRGMTLMGIYIDELSLIPKDFYLMALSRLSLEGAILLATTNPDTPNHYTNTDIIKNDDIDKQVIKFVIDDNIALGEDYKRNLKKEYTGVFYERFILGNYVAAEGAIYNIFSENKQQYFTTSPTFDYINVGVDFGGNGSYHTFVATGLKHDHSTLTALLSERHKATGTSPEDLNRLFGAFVDKVVAKYGYISTVYADSAEQVLINGLKAKFPNMTIRNSIKHEIIDRIRATTSLMAQGRLFLTSDCDTLVKAFEGALYDSKKQEDIRLDDGTSDIDTLDAFEYSFEREMNMYIKRAVN